MKHQRSSEKCWETVFPSCLSNKATCHRKLSPFVGLIKHGFKHVHGSTWLHLVSLILRVILGSRDWYAVRQETLWSPAVSSRLRVSPAVHQGHQFCPAVEVVGKVKELIQHMSDHQ